MFCQLKKDHHDFGNHTPPWYLQGYFVLHFLSGCQSRTEADIFYLKASPGAASPLSSIAIRLLDLGPHDSGDLVSWKEILFDIVGLCLPFWASSGFRDGLHGARLSSILTPH